jgi:DNA-binding FadR family transcriptional regulator
MDLLDVSRDTLREALRMLESESLIYIRRGRNGGAVVRRPDLRAIGRYVALLLQTRGVTLDDIHEARRFLEVPAVALLADHLSPELSRRMEALHDSQIHHTADPLGVARSFAQFDQSVVDLTGNAMLSLLSGIFRDSYAGEIYTSLRKARGRSAGLLDQVFAAQTTVVEAASQGDGDTVPELWLDYLDKTRQLGGSARRKPAPIDVTALWRAEVASDRADAQPDKVASTISVEIRSQIAEGRLNNGDRLAALPELASTFGVSRPTLREALRVLERESLLDLRTGTHGGARVRVPSTETAAQLAAIIIESEQTTIGDLWEARAVIDPGLLGLVAQRMTPDVLEKLRTTIGALGDAVSDTPRFTALWGEAESIMLGSSGNPAISVAMELRQWIRNSCRHELTAEAVNLPWVERSNRRATLRLNDVLTAAAKSDSDGAVAAWTDYVTYTTPFFQNLGDRLVLDMLD